MRRGGKVVEKEKEWRRESERGENREELRWEQFQVLKVLPRFVDFLANLTSQNTHHPIGSVRS